MTDKNLDFSLFTPVEPVAPADSTKAILDAIETLNELSATRMVELQSEVEALKGRQGLIEKYVGFLLTLVRNNPEFEKYLRSEVKGAESVPEAEVKETP